MPRCRAAILTTFEDSSKNAISPLNSGAVRISKVEAWTDYKIDVTHFYRGFTGQFAVWLACFLTDGPVIIAGMDCYGSENYYSDGRVWDMIKDLDKQKLAESQERGWRMAFNDNTGCDKPERIYAISGILTTTFKQYEPSRRLRSEATND